MKPRGTAQGAPMRAPLTAVSAFQRRASAHFLRRPRTGKIATSVITRVYAEKAAQRNGSVRLCEAQLWGAMCDFRSWHETDMPTALRNVRYQGQSGNICSVGAFPFLTRSGHGSQRLGPIVCPFALVAKC